MKKQTVFSLSLLALTLAGCSLAPTYERAPVSTPAAFKESPAGEQAALWKTAQPADADARGEWWTVFGDSTLNRLEEEAIAANQNLKAAAARVAQSRALRRAAKSPWWPSLGLNAGAARQRPSAVSQGLPDGTRMDTGSLYQAHAGIDYEVDLFGRVASQVDAANASTEQSEALLRSVLLALQADVAQGYFLLRELDAEQALYMQTVSLRTQSLDLVQRRFDAGDISELDLARAKTELASAESEQLGITRRRAEAEHALAVLLGKAPAEFSLSPMPIARLGISIPAGLPSTLLERRPDIAAAERAMAAANARIGTARAAWFPRLSLTSALGYESAALGNLFRWEDRDFLVGGVLSLPLFDGGKRRAGVKIAHATYEEEVANYRQTVLAAFRDVENSLSSLRLLEQQGRSQETAVTAATRAAALSHLQYREGSASYLDVMEADRSVLLQQRVAVQLDGEQARSTVSLIRALGGGWEVPEKMAGFSIDVLTLAQSRP